MYPDPASSCRPRQVQAGRSPQGSTLCRSRTPTACWTQTQVGNSTPEHTAHCTKATLGQSHNRIARRDMVAPSHPNNTCWRGTGSRRYGCPLLRQRSVRQEEQAAAWLSQLGSTLCCFRTGTGQPSPSRRDRNSLQHRDRCTPLQPALLSHRTNPQGICDEHHRGSSTLGGTRTDSSAVS
jgi:hypothetical protein